MSKLFDVWNRKAKALKKEVHAIYLSRKDPRVPWYSKALALLVVGYALSPIDLIPDPIPVLGYLDDLVLVPLGIMLVIKTIPPEVLAEYRIKANQLSNQDEPTNRIAMLIIIVIWILFLALGVSYVIKLLN